MVVQLNDEVRGKDPHLSTAWKKLRSGQKAAINIMFKIRFKKSRQVITRGVKERGFFAYEANFIKAKMIELGFNKPEDFPGFQLDLFKQNQSSDERVSN